ncbi:MAG: DUF2017 family protein [Jiangellaceae bacterium]
MKRRRGGGIDVQLSEEEREVLAHVVGQLREVMLADSDDPALRRLFPPAYADDPEKEAGYQVLARDELLESRLEAIDVVEASVAAESLDPEQAAAWMGAMNALRLVLGTRLDVSEDELPHVEPDDPELAAWVLYDFLSQLVAELVDALSGALPPGSDEPDLA